MAVHQSFETTDWESTRCAFIYLFSPKKWLSSEWLVSHLAKSLVQMIMQHANRIVSIAGQGIVNFAIMPLKKHSVLNLPNRQAKFFGGFNYRSTPRQISNSLLIHMDQPKAMVLGSSDKVNSVKTSIKTSILLAASRQGFTYCTWCVSSKMYINTEDIKFEIYVKIATGTTISQEMLKQTVNKNNIHVPVGVSQVLQLVVMILLINDCYVMSLVVIISRMNFVLYRNTPPPLVLITLHFISD